MLSGGPTLWRHERLLELLPIYTAAGQRLARSIPTPPAHRLAWTLAARACRGGVRGARTRRSTALSLVNPAMPRAPGAHPRAAGRPHGRSWAAPSRVRARRGQDASASARCQPRSACPSTARTRSVLQVGQLTRPAASWSTASAPPTVVETVSPHRGHGDSPGEADMASRLALAGRGLRPIRPRGPSFASAPRRPLGSSRTPPSSRPGRAPRPARSSRTPWPFRPRDAPGRCRSTSPGRARASWTAAPRDAASRRFPSLRWVLPDGWFTTFRPTRNVIVSARASIGRSGGRVPSGRRTPVVRRTSAARSRLIHATARRLPPASAAEALIRVVVGDPHAVERDRRVREQPGALHRDAVACADRVLPDRRIAQRQLRRGRGPVEEGGRVPDAAALRHAVGTGREDRVALDGHVLEGQDPDRLDAGALDGGRPAARMCDEGVVADDGVADRRRLAVERRQVDPGAATHNAVRARHLDAVALEPRPGDGAVVVDLDAARRRDRVAGRPGRDRRGDAVVRDAAVAHDERPEDMRAGREGGRVAHGVAREQLIAVDSHPVERGRSVRVDDLHGGADRKLLDLARKRGVKLGDVARELAAAHRRLGAGGPDAAALAEATVGRR